MEINVPIYTMYIYYIYINFYVIYIFLNELYFGFFQTFEDLTELYIVIRLEVFEGLEETERLKDFKAIEGWHLKFYHH